MAQMACRVHVHGVDDAWMVSRRLCLSAPSMCRRRHVIRACTMHYASSTPRTYVVHGYGIRARRTFALIAFLSVTDIYTLAQNRRPCCKIPCLASRSATIIVFHKSIYMDDFFNPIHPIGNSFRNHIKYNANLHIKSHKIMGILWAHTSTIGCIVLSCFLTVGEGSMFAQLART